MKLTLSTVYENIDQKWLELYLKRLESSGLHELIKTAKCLEKERLYSFTDQTSSMTVTTTYKLEE